MLCHRGGNVSEGFDLYQKMTLVLSNWFFLLFCKTTISKLTGKKVFVCVPIALKIYYFLNKKIKTLNSVIFFLFKTLRTFIWAKSPFCPFMFIFISIKFKRLHLQWNTWTCNCVRGTKWYHVVPLSNFFLKMACFHRFRLLLHYFFAKNFNVKSQDYRIF